MKILKTELLVVRVDGKVVDYEGMNDIYTTVQVQINEKDLNTEAIEYLENNEYITKYEDVFFLGENEAKDQYLEVGNLSIKIENVQVAFD